jgi:hypothetical protein
VRGCIDPFAKYGLGWEIGVGRVKRGAKITM